jgi:hypothetical protein
VPLIVLDVLPVADLGSGPRSCTRAGRFLNIGGVPALNIAVWDGTTLGGPRRRADADLAASRRCIHMTVWDDGSGPALYAGGTFNRADGSVVVSNVAKWDGSSWSSLGDGLDATVQELIAERDAHQPADGAEHAGLDEELPDDVLRVAPRARRMPISRVRSVTVASMMFMMPMPPTSRLIAGDRAEHEVPGELRAFGVLRAVRRGR